MTELQPLEVVRQVLRATGLEDVIGAEALESGLDQLAADLVSVGLDVERARSRGVRLAVAAEDYDNFPYLARLHANVTDALTLELPPELQAWTERLFAMPEPPLYEELRALLVGYAAADPNPIRRAIARVLLFECVLMSLVLLARRSPDFALLAWETGSLGAIADETVDRWLCSGPALPDRVRALEVIVHAAARALATHAKSLAVMLSTLDASLVETLRFRARLAARFAEMDAGVALLIRNTLAPELGESSFTVELLQKRHPLALGQVPRNTLDQRLRRAKSALFGGDTTKLRRRQKALIDLVDERPSGTLARRSRQ
jgi:hypothetical protein